MCNSMKGNGSGFGPLISRLIVAPLAIAVCAEFGILVYIGNLRVSLAIGVFVLTALVKLVPVLFVSYAPDRNRLRRSPLNVWIIYGLVHLLGASGIYRFATSNTLDFESSIRLATLTTASGPCLFGLTLLFLSTLAARRS